MWSEQMLTTEQNEVGGDCSNFQMINKSLINLGNKDKNLCTRKITPRKSHEMQPLYFDLRLEMLILEQLGELVSMLSKCPPFIRLKYQAIDIKNSLETFTNQLRQSPNSMTNYPLPSIPFETMLATLNKMQAAIGQFPASEVH